MMENRELFFEHEIDTEVFDSAFTEMLLGPKYRADACWKAFVDQCYANGSSSFDADIVFHVSFEHCDHARCSSAARRLVRMNVIELSSTKVRLRFRHFDMEGGRYSLSTVCEREVLCLRDFDSYSRPTDWPPPVLDQLRRLAPEKGKNRSRNRLHALRQMLPILVRRR
jgi:hypothetical protein